MQYFQKVYKKFDEKIRIPLETLNVNLDHIPSQSYTLRHDHGLHTFIMLHLQTLTACAPCDGIHHEHHEHHHGDNPEIRTPTLPSSLLKERKRCRVRVARDGDEKDKEYNEGNEEDEAQADMRIIAGLRRLIASEADRTDVKKYDQLLQSFEEQRLKEQSATMIESSEKVMGLLFDVKEKLTTEEYLALTSACQSMYHGDARITIGRAEDGREIHIGRSSLQKMHNFINYLNVARQLHGKILNKKRRMDELRNNPEVDVSLLEKEGIEVESIKAEHRLLIIKAYSDLMSVKSNNDSLMEIMNYGSLNLSYLCTLYDTGQTVEKKRKIAEK